MLVSIAKWYLSLAPVEVPDYWINHVPLARSRMEYEDEAGIEHFQRFFPSFDVAGKNLLDLGCGYGGRSVRWAEMGASVSAIEVVPEMVTATTEFAAQKGVHLTAALASAESLPFSDNTFDIVCSFDVFEHVNDFAQSLSESVRVLKPGGKLYAVFPPYYSAWGGSHLHVHLSKSPAPNALFPLGVLRNAAEALMRQRGTYELVTSFQPLRPGDKLWLLNGITISRFRSILKALRYTRAEIRQLPFVSRNGRRGRYVYWAFWLAAHIPLLEEVFTDRLVLIITK